MAKAGNKNGSVNGGDGRNGSLGDEENTVIGTLMKRKMRRGENGADGFEAEKRDEQKRHQCKAAGVGTRNPAESAVLNGPGRICNRMKLPAMSFPTIGPRSSSDTNAMK